MLNFVFIKNQIKSYTSFFITCGEVLIYNIMTKNKKFVSINIKKKFKLKL